MSLAQALPLAMFILMAELVIGSFAVMLLADAEGEVTNGFLGLNAAIFFAGAVFTRWIRSNYPPTDVLAGAGIRVEWLPREDRSFALFLLFLGLYNVLAWFGWRPGRLAVGAVAALAGLGTLVSAGMAYGQPPWTGPGTVANFVVASLVLGSAMTGMLLGHWYLVTPLLSPRPLRHMTMVLFFALLLQIVALPLYLGLIGFKAAAPAGQQLLSNYGLIIGVRVSLGLIFPIILAALAWHTTRIKAMRSATGLLYIGAGVVLAGEIVAKVLFFIAGVPT